jgi:hypothetical protein
LPGRWGRRRDLDLLDLQFVEVHRHRPRSVFSPFLDHDVVPDGAASGGLTELEPGPRVPFCVVAVDVERLDGEAEVVVGLAGEGRSVLARCSSAGEVTIEVSGGSGRPAGVLVAGPVAVPVGAPFQLALAVHENQVTVLVAGPAEELRPVLTERDRVATELDLRRPVVLAGLRYVHGVTGSGAAVVGRVRAGLSGPIGVRDPQVVRRPDGSPVVVDGKVYLTMTCAGLGFFQQAHWGVWTLDLADPARLEQVGALFFERDGLLLGDHAGHLVIDEEAGHTVVLVSSWGDHDVHRGVHVRHLTTTEDVLSGVHVLRSERLDLPSRWSTWDPSLARIDGQWHLAFTECVAFEPRYTFHPALAVATGPRYDQGWELVASDPARLQTEGTLLQRVGDRWYLLASDGDARAYPVYDTRLQERGTLAAPYGSNIPHPVLVQVGDHHRARWWLLTFDGTPFHDDLLGYGTHGDFLVLQAESGH